VLASTTIVLMLSCYTLHCTALHGGGHNQVYRVVHKGTGKIVTLRSHVETYANESTGTNSLVGLLQDITEICRMQQQEADQKAAHTALINTLAAASHSFF
jgi:hypothetical protein